jgi:hypothetical protein
MTTILSLNYISHRVSPKVNEHGDEIELETIKFDDHCRAVATICQDTPPFKDFFAEARDQLSGKAINELYLQAYTKS